MHGIRATGGLIVGTDGDGIDDAREGNVIAGNTVGINVDSGSNAIAGNLIGIGRDGITAFANTVGVIIASAGGTRVGTNADGVSDQFERNVISHNNSTGIEIGSADGVLVAGNYIGLDATGLGNAGNGGAGILVIDNAGASTIGGDGPSRNYICLLYTSPSPRDLSTSRMPSSA